MAVERGMDIYARQHILEIAVDHHQPSH
jgi:hypothetical protein